MYVPINWIHIHKDSKSIRQAQTKTETENLTLPLIKANPQQRHVRNTTKMQSLATGGKLLEVDWK